MANEFFDDSREANEAFISLLDDADGIKQAADIGSKAITRLLLREEEFTGKILPPEEVKDNELVLQLDSDHPVVYHWLEKTVPYAVQVGFGDMPDEFVAHVDRYPISGTMIQSPRITKYEQELRIYPFDILQMFADNIVKDLGYQVDQNFIAGLNDLLVGANSNMPWSAQLGYSVPQWRSLSGGWTKVNITEALTTLQKTPYCLKPETCLANTVTLMKFIAWTRDEAGGDIAQEMFKKGFTERNLFGVNWYGTIKRYLISDYTFYQFAAPKFIGAYKIFQQPTMFIEAKQHKKIFHCDKMIGAVIGNLGSVARIDAA